MQFPQFHIIENLYLWHVHRLGAWAKFAHFPKYPFNSHSCWNNLQIYLPSLLLSPALAGTELSKGVICVYIHEICFIRDFMGLKRQKLSWSLLARYLYTRQRACEPQTGSLAYFSVAVRNGTKKRPVLSIEVLRPSTCRLLLSLYLYTRTNLNKGASGSVKLNPWHATTSRQLGKNILDTILWSVSEMYQRCIKFFASHLWLTTVYMINPIPSLREWGLVLVKLSDFSVVAVMNQKNTNCSRSTPITGKIGHKNIKEQKYFWHQTEIKLKYFQQAIVMVT